MTKADKIGEETLGQTQYEKDLNTTFEQRADALPEANSPSDKSDESAVAEQFGGQVNDLVDMSEIGSAQDDPTKTGRDDGLFDVQGDRASTSPIKQRGEV